jgi:hypothetical protein
MTTHLAKPLVNLGLAEYSHHLVQTMGVFRYPFLPILGGKFPLFARLLNVSCTWSNGNANYFIYIANMKVYLDNCCFNSPFDDQSNIVNRMESDVKLFNYTLWQRDLYKNMSVKELYDKIKDSEEATPPTRL